MHPACAGKDHLVLADMGCRNTVFNATAQSGLPFVPEFAAAGVGCFRQALGALVGAATAIMGAVAAMTRQLHGGL